jgi:signal transduction histidine kinase
MTTNRAPSKIIPRAFPGITTDEVAELITNSKVSNYQTGTILCRENAVEDTFYLILEGQVEVTKMINNIEVRQLKTLGAGDFFGEMALIHNAPRAATVKAITALITLEICKEDFDRVLKNSSSVSLAMVREISNRLRQNDAMAIDDLRLRASELAEAYQKLAEQEVTRREFLTNVAHQLRTPLTAASGYLHMMQIGAVPAGRLGEAINAVTRNVQQITALVNDILFVQEMELILGKFQPVNMADLAREVAAAYQEKARIRKVDLRVKADLFLSPVAGDLRSLERALTALVDNAVKFSPEGGKVEIGLRRKGGQIAVSVSDQGIGIAPEHQEKIFDRYYHIDRSGDRLFEGLGLGLAIAKQVIEQHKGQLTVDSTPRKGSTFTMWLNIWREEKETEKEGGTTL